MELSLSESIIKMMIGICAIITFFVLLTIIYRTQKHKYLKQSSSNDVSQIPTNVNITVFITSVISIVFIISLGIDLIILKNIGSDIIVQESISVNDIAKVFELVDLALMQQEDLVDIDNIDEFRGDPQIAIFELFFHGNEFVNLQFTTVQYEKYLSCNKSFQVTKYGKLFVSSEDGILINTFEDRIISLSNLQNAFNVIYESRRSPIAGKVNTGTITFAYGGIIHISDIPVKVIQRGNTYFIKDGNLQPIDANILNNSKYNKCYVINIVTDGEIIYILFEL